MSRQREGDTQLFPFRSGRFFSVNGQWYFAAREASAYGPFDDRPHAEQALRRFLARRAEKA